jgi:hypothetical protein
MSGKGSSPRPYSVDQKTFSDNWDKIFRKDKREVEDASAENEAFNKINEDSKTVNNNMDR